jgi:hypothetical protein
VFRVWCPFEYSKHLDPITRAKVILGQYCRVRAIGRLIMAGQRFAIGELFRKGLGPVK